MCYLHFATVSISVLFGQTIKYTIKCIYDYVFKYVLNRLSDYFNCCTVNVLQSATRIADTRQIYAI